jgi:CRP/FNR family cyclic AMP-dependent transcriptional regulator
MTSPSMVCTSCQINLQPSIRVLHDKPAFSEMFVAHLLARTIRVEADLVDQLFNSSEKRLARALSPCRKELALHSTPTA